MSQQEVQAFHYSDTSKARQKPCFTSSICVPPRHSRLVGTVTALVCAVTVHGEIRNTNGSEYFFIEPNQTAPPSTKFSQKVF